MFVWVTLPGSLDARSVLAEAVRLGVAFVPGAAFHVDGGGTASLRLNFTNSGPAEIREGLGRLARAAELAAGLSPRSARGRG
jgi:2-aminoadipate transaminase